MEDHDNNHEAYKIRLNQMKQDMRELQRELKISNEHTKFHQASLDIKKDELRRTWDENLKLGLELNVKNSEIKKLTQRMNTEKKEIGTNTEQLVESHHRNHQTSESSTLTDPNSNYEILKEENNSLQVRFDQKFEENNRLRLENEKLKGEIELLKNLNSEVAGTHATTEAPSINEQEENVPDIEVISQFEIEDDNTQMEAAAIIDPEPARSPEGVRAHAALRAASPPSS